MRNFRFSFLVICMFSLVIMIYKNASSQEEEYIYAPYEVDNESQQRVPLGGKIEWADEDDRSKTDKRRRSRGPLRNGIEWADEDEGPRIYPRYEMRRPPAEGIEWADEDDIEQEREEAEGLGSVEHFQCIGPFSNFTLCLLGHANPCADSAADFCGGEELVESYSCSECGYYKTAAPVAVTFDDMAPRTQSCPPEGSSSGWYSQLTFECKTPAPSAQGF